MADLHDRSRSRKVFAMRKQQAAKQHRGISSARASTAIPGSNSGSPPEAKKGPGARRGARSGKSLVELLKALGDLRRKAGISGIATIVGFFICLHAHTTSLILTLLAVAGFTLIMILLQWFERWTKDTTV